MKNNVVVDSCVKDDLIRHDTSYSMGRHPLK